MKPSEILKLILAESGNKLHKQQIEFFMKTANTNDEKTIWEFIYKNFMCMEAPEGATSYNFVDFLNEQFGVKFEFLTGKIDGGNYLCIDIKLSVEPNFSMKRLNRTKVLNFYKIEL